jgi:hypothetical protein
VFIGFDESGGLSVAVDSAGYYQTSRTQNIYFVLLQVMFIPAVIKADKSPELTV